MGTLDRLKATARQKLQRAVAEVVEAESARAHQRQSQLHAEAMAALDQANRQLDEGADRLAAAAWNCALAWTSPTRGTSRPRGKARNSCSSTCRMRRFSGIRTTLCVSR